MAKNAEHRMYKHIISLLGQEGFDVFEAPVKGEGSDIIIRNIDNNGKPQYIELQILSRTEEFLNPLSLPVDYKSINGYYFIILYSTGMNKFWIHTADELLELQKLGDDRDSSPYLVKDFTRLKFPHLTLGEFKAQQ